MQDNEIIRAIEAKEQALEAMRIITGQRDINVLVSDMGSHLAMWVCWCDIDGNPTTRQFSWTREQPGHDGIRLQWIYDALSKYGRLQKIITDGIWRGDYEEDQDFFI